MLENFDMKSKVILDLKNGTLIEDEDDIMSLPVQVEKYLTS